MSTFHTLVVTEAKNQMDWPYQLTCPGVTDDCRAWRECRPCSERAAGDEDYDDQLYADEEAHGVEHHKLMGCWCTPTDGCLVVTHEFSLEAVRELAPDAGQYQVKHMFIDSGEYIEFELVAAS